MVREISSSQEFDAAIATPGKLVVADFYASWCGPCKQIAPFVEELSNRYTDVIFIKVAEHICQDVIMARGVRAFPTFQFFIAGEQVDELRGADQHSLVAKIEQHRTRLPRSFEGHGMTLGSASAEDPREARLRKLKQQPMSDSDAQAMIQKALEDTASSMIPAQPNPVASTRALTQISANTELLSQLIEMGFSETRSRKALLHTSSLEGAIAWLEEHQDDPNIDQEAELDPSSDEALAMQMDVENRQTLTAEEIKEKLAKRRIERAAEEKELELKRERERRDMGKKTTQTAEEMQTLARKREIDRIKREKEEAKRERERIRAELAKDRAERKAHGGKLASRLGVEGYNPSAIQYEATENSGDSVAHTSETKGADGASEPKSDRTPEEQVNLSIQRLARYRVGGDGGIALRTLRTMIGNVVANPAEEKYRSVNLENKAFKQKVAALVGGISLLNAVGFVKNDTRLALEESNINLPLLTQTLSKLDAAINAYAVANPGV